MNQQKTVELGIQTVSLIEALLWSVIVKDRLAAMSKLNILKALKY
jgi:hypothetical protein